MQKVFVSLFVLLLVWGELSAQKKVYTTCAVEGDPPEINGVIDDPSWDLVPWEGNFIQREPFENQEPSQQTQFKILYDNNNVYIAIRAFDSEPDSIVQRMSRRDGFEGDWLEVNIDSYHDLRTAFSFTVTAAGVKGDEHITNGTSWDPNWNPIWYVKTSIDNQGWVAEMQIPLSQLRFGKQDEYVWGLQINRRLYRKEEISNWQFISPTASGWVHLFGELHGIQSITPKKQREITPYILGGIETYQHDPENPFAPGKELRGAIGIDGKWGLTNDFTLDFTINPDFGQVEADPSEVNLTVFETKFDERRPFFIEGKNILSLDILDGGGPLASDNLFYSRRIGKKPSYYPDLEDNEYIKWPASTSILGAAKLTGKTRKGLSLGILESVTQHETATIDREGERRVISVEPLTNFMAGRVQQDFNGSNTLIGAMVTYTQRFSNEDYLMDILHRSAFTAGFDFTHQWKDKTYYLKVKSAYSRVTGNEHAITETQTTAPHFFQRPDALHIKLDTTLSHLSGYGGCINYGKSGNGKISYTLWLAWRSPGLHLNDIGFHNFNDHVQQVSWLGYRQTEPMGKLRNFNINLNQWLGLSFGMENLYYGGNINAHWTFMNNGAMGFNVEREFPAYTADFLRGGPALRYDGLWNLFGHANTSQKKKIQFSLETFHQFRDGKTELNQNYYIGIRWQVADALNVSLNPGYTLHDAGVQWVESVDFGNEKRHIIGAIDQVTTQLTFRLSYNLTPDFTIECYAMPFISAGNYSDFRYVSNPRAGIYKDRYAPIRDDQIVYDAENEVYTVDENRDGVTDYSFDQPGFNVFDFNSNLVLRWEYLPGSTLYLVWSQNRNEYFSNGTFRFGDDIQTLFSETYPHDVLLLKFSYRIGN